MDKESHIDKNAFIAARNWTGSAPPEAVGKKAYRRPELLEWGSILDLTQGGKGGLDDFPPSATGTQPFFAPPPTPSRES